MTSRVAYFLVLVCMAVGAPIADHPLMPEKRTSGSGEVLMLEFPGHPAAYCGYHAHPEAANIGSFIKFIVLQRGEDGRGVRDTYYCTLAGDEVDFKQLAEDNKLAVRSANLTDAWPVLELGRVQCVLRPPGSAPAGLFDFRVTRLSSGLPPFLCLSLDAARSLAPPLGKIAAPPERDALVFRFSRGHVPDLVCRPFSDVPLAESDIEVEVFGFLHPASGPLNCHFRRVYEGESAADLLSRLSQEMRAQLVRRSGLAPTFTLPNFTCQAAMRADQPAPPADKLSSTSSSSTFAVTGPSSRWTVCSMSFDDALDPLVDMAIKFLNIPRIICRFLNVPKSSSLNGTEFYFILEVGPSTQVQCRFAGLPKSESDLDARLRELLETSSKEMEATVRYEGGAPLLEAGPIICVNTPAKPAPRLPPGSAPFVFSVGGKDLNCVMARRRPPTAQVILCRRRTHKHQDSIRNIQTPAHAQKHLPAALPSWTCGYSPSVSRTLR